MPQTRGIAEASRSAKTLLQVVRSDTDFDGDPQRFDCRIVAKQHSHGLFRNGGEARGCPVEASSTSAPLDLVPSISDADVDAGDCSAGRATARCACKSPRIGLAASTSAAPAIAAKQGRVRAGHGAGTVDRPEMRTFGDKEGALRLRPGDLSRLEGEGADLSRAGGLPTPADAENSGTST